MSVCYENIAKLSKNVAKLQKKVAKLLQGAMKIGLQNVI